jgi:hypothetical protein
MALAAGDDEVNRWPPAPDVSAANANLSIDPSGISISKYTTYFVPLKQSNRLVGIAGGKDVVACIVQFIGCGQTDECFIFDN